MGPILGGFAFLLGFAMVWHIWWLAAFSGLVMLGTVALRTFADDTEFCLTAAEVEAIEDQRHEALAKASHPETASKDPTFSAQMLPGRLS